MASSSSGTWTAEDIRRNAATWSLEGDAKLLEFMKTISQNLEKRATAAKQNIIRLTLDVQHTSVALDNATNKLAALQHTQFVENRVYDDDETTTNGKNDPVDTKDEQKPYNPTDILKTIMKNSLTVLDECYEKVSVNIDDSDEEDGAKSIIYRPKNPFDQRPLPHIIGTKEWKEKWHIGLCDSDEDYSDDDKDDEQYSTDSESENVSLTASLPSNAPTVSESEISSTWGLQKNKIERSHSNKMQFMNSSDDDDIDEISSNTITSKNSESEDSGNRMIPSSSSAPHNIPPMLDTPIPDQRYYIHKPRERNLFDESSSNGSDDNDNYTGTQKNAAQNNNKIHENLQQQILKVANQRNANYNRISNIINDEPPPDLDEVDREKFNENNDRNQHQQKQQSQYFIKNDTDNFSSADKVNDNHHKDELSQSIDNHDDNNHSRTNIRKKTVNLFDDDDFNSFMKELSDKNSEKVNKDKANVIKSKNLFDDDDESEVDEDSIFSVNKKLNHSSVQAVTKEKDKSNTSTEKPPQKIETPPSPSSERESDKTAGIMPEKKTKMLNLFDDTNDDFDTIFGSTKNQIKEKALRSNELFTDGNLNATNNNDVNVLEKGTKNTVANLFSEKSSNRNNNDVDDDVFKVDDNKFVVDTNANANQENQIRNESIPSTNRVNLFPNSLSDDDDLFEKNNAKNSTNDDILSEKKDDEQQVITESSSLSKSEIVFDDKTTTNTADNFKQDNPVKIPKLSNLFFDEEDDDMFDFSRKITIKNVESEKDNRKNDGDNIKIPKANTTHLTNLFSDNDDENDLFAFVKKSENTTKTTANSISTEEKIRSNEDQTVTASEGCFADDQNDDGANKFQSSVNENLLNTKISTLMNLFSDEPPSDDGDDDIFRFNSTASTNKSKSDQITEKLLSTSISSPEKRFTDDENQRTQLPQPSTSSEIETVAKRSSEDEFSEKSYSNESKTSEIEKVPDNGEIVNEHDNNEFSQKIQNATETNKNNGDFEIENVSEEQGILNEGETVNERFVIPIEKQLNSHDELMNKSETNAEDIVPDDQITSTKTITDEIHSFNEDTIAEEIITSKTLLEQNSISHQSTLNYNPIGLFQDIPPDDDFQFTFTNNEQKQQRSQNIIFYDDFSETITTPQAAASNPVQTSSNYNIFSDEPPPDTFLDLSTNAEILSNQKNEIKKTTNNVAEKLNDTTNKFSNSIIENENKSKTVAELAKNLSVAASVSEKIEPLKPQPKKLNTNLNINVAALLPGAKRPSLIVSDTKESSNVRHSTDEENVSTHPPVVPKYSTTTASVSEHDHNILTSLNKTRAKIPIKRRPSTRKARQENYRKSLLADDNAEEFSNPERIDESVRTTISEVIKSTNSENHTFDDEKSNVDSFIVSKQQAPVISDGKLFDDDDKKEIFAPKILNVNEESGSSSAFGQTTTKPILSNKIETTAPTIPIPIPKAKVTTFSSDEDDDLFAQKTKVLPFSKSITLQKSDRKSTTNPVNSNTEAKPFKSSGNSKKIFDDDSDDDLFATKPTTLKTKQNSNIVKEKEKEQKQSNVYQNSLRKQSIFSSDDDDDDDLFGGGKQIKTPKVTMNKTENIDKFKSQQQQHTTKIKTASLFDDDELDDDDLFGGGNKSSNNLAKPVNVPAPKKSERKVIASKNDFNDNPLSDLLKD